ncbi:MAG: formylglycine-generating enzyme family protein [Cyclobacteriaceae bacterium]
MIKYVSLIFLLFLAACNGREKTNDVPKITKSIPVSNTAPGEAPEGMVWIPGGTFMQGSDGEEAMYDEGPAHTTRVDGFWMDATEVTNAEFREFTEATGYLTVAERPIDWEEMKKMLPEGTPKPADSLLQPGSMVFDPPEHAVPLNNHFQWWNWVIGANWQHPYGPDSDIDGKDNYPVVHIAYEDAVAYAEWAGKRLPTEAEYEFAARNNVDGKPFAWGDELTPQGKYLANFFQGDFPYRMTSEDGYAGIAPVKSYPANEYGLYDIIGNVWEWTSDWYRPDAYSLVKDITICDNPTGPEASYDPAEPYTPKRVIKGGSYLCSDQYCSNYRPSARMATAIDSGQEHLGFRCVKSPS